VRITHASDGAETIQRVTLTLLSPALVGRPVVLNRLHTAPPLENTDRAWRCWNAS